MGPGIGGVDANDKHKQNSHFSYMFVFCMCIVCVGNLSHIYSVVFVILAYLSGGEKQKNKRKEKQFEIETSKMSLMANTNIGKCPIIHTQPIDNRITINTLAILHATIYISITETKLKTFPIEKEIMY